jgi:ABC-type multidrug transport system ATPase subunit
MTSHLLREIEPVCSRIAILHNRRVQKIGTMESLKDDFSENTEIHVESFPGKYDPLINKLKGKNVKAISKGHKMIVFTKKAEFMLPKVMSLLRSKKEKLIELDITRPTLEEIFEEITKVQQNITLQPQKKMSIKDALSTKTKYLLAKILHKKRVEIQQKPVEEKVNQG